MSFREFMVHTCTVEHVTGHDAWQNPVVSTFIVMGRFQPSNALYRDGVGESRMAKGELFIEPHDSVAQQDFVTVGGVRYQIVSGGSFDDKFGNSHHMEFLLDAGA